ncbi:hypothetical protein GCM10017589_45320 [Streptomyces poonensis]|nr:hypothetical protein GCM10017589_45320 [Streptomyces poonensis]
MFVPVPADRLRAALSDPERVARAVPGLQQEAGAPPVAGRLKVRVAGHSITYRGALRVADRGDGSYTVEGDGTEARGSGSVKLSLTVGLRPAEDDGTTLVFTGTASADGRVADLPSDAVSTATARLLNRFAENLARVSEEEHGEHGEQEGDEEHEKHGEHEGHSVPPPQSPSPSEAAPASASDTEVPPPSLDPDTADDLEPGDLGGPGDLGPGDLGPEDLVSDDFTDPGELPAEAAHARRTMIGRSAEEVDHAPPRGRYAPVPAPESAAPSPALRWAAPAAALALASAIVVTRALRKRR